MSRPSKAQLGLLRRVSMVSPDEGWGATNGLHWTTIESCLANGWVGALGGDGMSGLRLTDAGLAVLATCEREEDGDGR